MSFDICFYVIKLNLFAAEKKIKRFNTIWLKNNGFCTLVHTLFCTLLVNVNYASEFLRIWNQFTFRGTLQNVMSCLSWIQCVISISIKWCKKLGNSYIFKPVKRIKILNKNQGILQHQCIFLNLVQMRCISNPYINR